MPLQENLTLRANLGRPLTWLEGDANWSLLLANDKFLNVRANEAYALAEQTNNALANKVDKVAGKGLSTNDYSVTDKAKVDALGNAATRTVTSSATDTTAGRLLKTGDGGWMGDVPTNTVFSLDDRSLRGWRYVAAGSTTGTFPPGVNYGHVHTFGNNGDAVGQELWAFEGASQTYTRWYRQCFGSGAWGKWEQIAKPGDKLAGQSLIECIAPTVGGQVTDLTIRTKIPTNETVMPFLVIEGALNGYTNPIRIELSWYYYEGAFYLPQALITTALYGLQWPKIRLSYQDGFVTIRLDFEGLVYIPRLVVRAIKTGGVYGGEIQMYQGWTSQVSTGAFAGEVLVPSASTLRLSDIERGQNGNGSYVRFPDGTVEIWKSFGVYCVANTLKQQYIDLPTVLSLAYDVTPTLSLGAPSDTWGFECKQLAGVIQSGTSIMVSMNCTVSQQYIVFIKITGRWK